VHSRAVYDGPFGCRVLHPGREVRFFQSQAHDPQPPAVSLSPIAGAGVVAPVNDSCTKHWTTHLLNPIRAAPASPRL
jgi:hypothetical protein